MALRQTIDALCLARLGRRLDLENPRSYNEVINWCKIHDQTKGHIIACDKLAVRDVVAATVGPKYLLPVFESAERFDDLTYRAPCIAKVNHDSGTTIPVRNELDWMKAKERITLSLGRSYGVRKAEWAYAGIKPRCFTERLMPHPVVDYKFHCVAGQIRWVQIISERGTGSPVEAITDPAGRHLPLHLDHDMRHAERQPYIPPTWNEMCEVAKELSRPWRYVRVDLYSSLGRVYFGEMTFWPKAGCYKTKDEPAFGAMLDIDMSFKREPLVA
jgi:hypothetical protein